MEELGEGERRREQCRAGSHAADRQRPRREPDFLALAIAVRRDLSDLPTGRGDLLNPKFDIEQHQVDPGPAFGVIGRGAHGRVGDAVLANDLEMINIHARPEAPSL